MRDYCLFAENMADAITKSVEFVCCAVVLVVLIVFIARIIVAVSAQCHERKMKELDFLQKKEWEEFVSKKVYDKRLENLSNELNEYKEKVKELVDNSEKIKPLDMNRISLLHLVLSGCKEGITAENLEKEMDKIKKTYEIIKNDIK